MAAAAVQRLAKPICDPPWGSAQGVTFLSVPLCRAWGPMGRLAMTWHPTPIVQYYLWGNLYVILKKSMPTLPRKYGFCFTLNNYTPEEIEVLRNFDCQWMIFQTEVSATGTPHLQGALWLETASTVRALKRRLALPRIHLEIARGTAQESRVYCTKLDSRAEDNYLQFEHGTVPLIQGTRTDLKQAMIDAETLSELELYQRHPLIMVQYGRSIMRYKLLMQPRQTSHPVITVLWGETGVGKSHRCELLASNNLTRDYFSMLTPERSKQIWFDGYSGQEDVLIEDYGGEIPYRLFLRMLDRYHLLVQVKGSSTNWCPKRIWISSNLHPKDWYDNPEWNEQNPLHRRLTTHGSRIVQIHNKEQII